MNRKFLTQVNLVATGLLALSLSFTAGTCRKAEKDSVALEKDSSVSKLKS